jgi:hypothetical protein
MQALSRTDQSLRYAAVVLIFAAGTAVAHRDRSEWRGAVTVSPTLPGARSESHTHRGIDEPNEGSGQGPGPEAR